MKRKTAKEMLADSFREVAEKKPVDKITVSDIIENCGYSKTTFYRSFKDKYDLMAWDYLTRQKQIMDQMDNTDYEWKTTLIEGALLFNEEKDYLKNLLLHTNGIDSFSRNMKEVHFGSLKKCVLDASGMKELDVKTEMYVRTYCQGTVDLICDWIMGMYDVSPKELAEVFENCLPEPLRKYLL
ncbi:MAG: TetR/AcrR family transcriptional regulator C-terminal domain-containing protein [Lachnospiraceae bacterium]|nr:TetR/AcrR family transcriptional regulator C-terminal domain-containing protein [Lachnospiraceae bacterium]